MLPQQKSKCSACAKPYRTTNMVQCDECNKWLHYECVGVDDSIRDLPWKCVPCGGDPYPEASGLQSVEKSTAPTVEDVLALLENQQARESKLKEDYERMANEYEAVKRMLNSSRARDGTTTRQHVGASERFQRALEAESRLSVSSFDAGSVRQVPLGPDSLDTPSSRSSHYTPKVVPTKEHRVQNDSQQSELSQLAILMKQAHVEELPKFRGNAKDWPLFLAVFNRTSTLASIDDVTNVGRLTKALEGEARELVLDQLTFGLSPKGIIETLEKRYGQKDVVLRTLSTDLMKFPVLTGTKDLNLRKFAIALRTHVAQLKALNLQHELKNSLLESLLLEKMTNIPSMYRKWKARKRSNDLLNLEDFANFVMEEWECLPPPNAESINSYDHQERKKNSKSQSVNVHALSEKSPVNTCRHCEKPHALADCFKFQKLSVNDRWEIAKKAKVCFSCLSSHVTPFKDCPERRQCREPGCDSTHHRLLHKERNSPEQVNRDQPETTTPSLNANAGNFEPRNYQPQTSSHQTHGGDGIAVTAKVVAIRIFGADGNYVDDFAFLDDGSTLTLMEQRIADHLGISGERESLHLRWTKGITRVEDASRSDVTLSGITGKQRFTLQDVYCVPELDLSPVSQNGSELAKRYRHLSRLPLPSFENVKPGILIGLEHATMLGGRHVIEGKLNEPLASKTKLGWVVYGRQGRVAAEISSVNAGKQGLQQCHTRLERVESREDRQLHDLVKSFFNVESVGVLAKQLRSADDKRAELIMERTTRKVDGRYEVGLLWKTDNEQLPNNEIMAMKRLVSEERKLMKDAASLQWMNEHVQKLLEKGYAREATLEDLETEWERKWICPLFTVINRNKIPPKRRCVSDVAATEAGVSLNSCLMKGPDNLIALPAALCRARENPVMVTADVAEMFHQVRIIQRDQQCQRFLWRDGDQSRPPTTFVMQAMMFGPTCSPFQAQYVKNKHAEEYRGKYPEAAEALVRFMYMDDYFNSHQTIEDAVEVTLNAVEICKEMGFNLVQVQSSHDEVLKRMPEHHVKQDLVSLNVEESATYTSKLLGMFWSPSDDSFLFKCAFGSLLTRMTEENYRPTKREILSALMKIFDPLGLIAKYVVRGKCLLRKVWREKIGWDEKLPKNLAEEWLRFLQSFSAIEKMRIPRWYGGRSEPGETVELVIFVDASDKACAAVAYFRFSNGKEVRVAMVMAKTKVAPVKALSIPRLELEAAKLGARLAETIGRLHSFPIHRRIFLSDSSCVLAWIHSTRFDFVPFVAHRVSEILETTQADEWWKVGTNDNVADDGTKENEENGEASSSRWFSGPEFLLRPLSEWPVERYRAPKIQGDIATHLHRTDIEEQDDHFINRIGSRFRGNWRSLVRVVAQVKRAQRNFQAKRCSNDGPLSTVELTEAEKEIFRLVQQEAFADHWREMANGHQSELKSKSAGELNALPLQMVREERLLRLASRDRTSATSFSAKNRIVLPKRHEFVQLFLQHLHEQNFHMGIESTIAEAREKVWIVSIRQALRITIASCQPCKNRRAKPERPTMGNLHESRTAFDKKPFSFVGVDCFGPITVRVKRSDEKRWGVIFTCLTYRCVHLEIVQDVSSDQMLLAIRRLVARRGPLRLLYSDNGTNFVGASRVLKEENREAQRRLTEVAAKELKLDWRFIPAYSPWTGGAWERLIGYIKKCIQFCLSGETPSDVVLSNAMIEAELLTNKRPLTHTPIDPDDDEPLTPNLALFGSSDATQALCPDDDVNKFARMNRKRVAHLVRKFQHRWEREYLPVIAKKDSATQKNRNVVEGDVVLLAEGNDNREHWKIGRIIRIHPTNDGVPRIVDVKMGTGEVKYRRAVGNLAVLDVRESAEQ